MATQEVVERVADVFAQVILEADEYEGSLHPEIVQDLAKKLDDAFEKGDELSPPEMMAVLMLATGIAQKKAQEEAKRKYEEAMQRVKAMPAAVVRPAPIPQHEIEVGCSLTFVEGGATQQGRVVSVDGREYVVAYTPILLRHVKTEDVLLHEPTDRAYLAYAPPHDFLPDGTLDVGGQVTKARENEGTP